MKRLTRREFLESGAIALAAGASLRSVAHGAGPTETLYNGIRLANPWPPQYRSFNSEPQIPPYLADPPPVIPIDVGRQLFVDDFLIEERGLYRAYHRAQYHPGNPILRPTTAWELRDEYADRTRTNPNPAAMVFSDGVFFDPTDRLFKMWYMGGYSQNTCLALSRDGLSWDRPLLDVVPGTNVVLALLRDSSTVWLDLEENDPAARFKMAFYNGSEKALLLYVSSDGSHWRKVGQTGPTGDRSTMFYNAFRKMWVFSLRDDRMGNPGRFRRYWERRAFAGAPDWRADEPPLWAKSDALDFRRPEINVPTELYNLDCVAYESILLGLFTIFRGEGRDREKPNELCVGFSRDGFHWTRPNRRPFIGVSERVGDWNWGNVQSAGGCCLVVDDRLFFYVSGRQGRPGTSEPGVCSTGLATLRRDGFVSVTDRRDASNGEPERLWPRGVAGTLTTRPLTFNGQYLFVNAAANGGSIHVEVLDRAGHVIDAYSKSRAIPVQSDATRIPVRWEGASTLAHLVGEVVRFRFSMNNARLYSFWVSPSARGQSRGHMGAGGPGFSGALDL